MLLRFENSRLGRVLYFIVVSHLRSCYVYNLRSKFRYSFLCLVISFEWLWLFDWDFFICSKLWCFLLFVTPILYPCAIELLTLISKCTIISFWRICYFRFISFQWSIWFLYRLLMTSIVFYGVDILQIFFIVFVKK